MSVKSIEVLSDDAATAEAVEVIVRRLIGRSNARDRSDFLDARLILFHPASALDEDQEGQIRVAAALWSLAKHERATQRDRRLFFDISDRAERSSELRRCLGQLGLTELSPADEAEFANKFDAHPLAVMTLNPAAAKWQMRAWQALRELQSNTNPSAGRQLSATFGPEGTTSRIIGALLRTALGALEAKANSGSSERNAQERSATSNLDRRDYPDSTESALAALQERFQTRLDDLRRSQLDLTSAREDVIDLTRKLQAATLANNEATAEIAILRSESRRSAEEIELRGGHLDVVRSDLSAAMKNLAVSAQQKIDLATSLERCERLQQDITEQQHELEHALQQAKSENSNARQREEDLKQRIDAASKLATERLDELESLRAAHRALETSMKLLSANHKAEMSAANAESVRYRAMYQSELERAASDLSAMAIENKSLKESASVAANEILSLSAKLEDARTGSDFLQQTIRECGDENLTLKAALDTERMRNVTLEKRLVENERYVGEMLHVNSEMHSAKAMTEQTRLIVAELEFEAVNLRESMRANEQSLKTAERRAKGADALRNEMLAYVRTLTQLAELQSERIAEQQVAASMIADDLWRPRLFKRWFWKLVPARLMSVFSPPR